MTPTPTPSPTRVTLADVEAAIVDAHYFIAREGAEGACGGGGTYPIGLGLLTICVLTLNNGFTVLGESSCVAPERFDAQTGREVAYIDAVRKIWPLLGFALQTRLAAEGALGEHD